MLASHQQGPETPAPADGQGIPYGGERILQDKMSSRGRRRMLPYLLLPPSIPDRSLLAARHFPSLASGKLCTSGMLNAGGSPSLLQRVSCLLPNSNTDMLPIYNECSGAFFCLYIVFCDSFLINYFPDSFAKFEYVRSNLRFSLSAACALAR